MKPILLLSYLGYLTASSLFLVSCYPGPIVTDPYLVDEGRQKENIYYVPSAPNAPLLTEKNDLSFSAMRSSGSNFSGGGIDAAFMPAKHIGITASYSFMKNDIYMKYNRFEFGSGYVTKLSKGWHFETYAGLGNGKITNTHHTGTSELNLTHYFLQPAIAISNKKKTVQFGFVSRFEGVNFKVIDTLFSTDRESFSASQITNLYNQPFHIMWQPGFVFRFGWKNFLFHTGYSWSTDLTNPAVYGEKGNFSLGMELRFNVGEKSISK